ncbi:MAG: MBL fold metallo-hydrolase [Spirochaetes bacterium]|nr:MBL fold metallo-hydrolase [Spirochaetota bacterium]
MRLTIWGAFGSIVSPDRDKWRYGGNTACLEITHGDGRLVVDAGIGLVPFGDTLSRFPLGKGKGVLHLAFSHLHWDHIQGLPFFVPAFIPGNEFHFYGTDRHLLEECVEKLFRSTFSPVNGADKLGARIAYHELAGPADISGLAVRCAPLRHPDGATAFRIEAGGRAIVLAFDHEAGDDSFDRPLRELASGADVLVHDAQYDPADYPAHEGWGHSTWRDAVETALAARVKTLVLFHHDPDRSDAGLDEFGRKASAAAAGHGLEVLVARDRMVLDL